MLAFIDSFISVPSLIWLSLVMFVIHDLEEIIWVDPVLKKNKQLILQRLPKHIGPKVQDMLDITSSQFAVAVLIEFIILSVIVFFAAEHGQYLLFLSFMSIFWIHVFTHLGQALVLKMYTPGVVSAIVIVLPFTTYVFYRLLNESLVFWNDIALSIPFGFFIIPIILFGHSIGKKVAPNRE